MPSVVFKSIFKSMIARFDYGTFGKTDWEDLDGRMMLGRVEFMFLKVSDGSVRYAVGTRNLSDPAVGWSLLPMNIQTPPDHVLTFVDMDKSAWRCFVKDNLLWYSDVVEIPD